MNDLGIVIMFSHFWGENLQTADEPWGDKGHKRPGDPADELTPLGSPPAAVFGGNNLNNFVLLERHVVWVVGFKVE